MSHSTGQESSGTEQPHKAGAFDVRNIIGGLIGFYGVQFYLGGTSILIVVSVTMDTVAQVQSHLLAHQYEGLIKKAKLRGARR